MDQLVVVTTKLPDDCRAKAPKGIWLIEGDDQFKPMDRAQVLHYAAEAFAILNQCDLTIDEDLLSKAPALKLVANATAGFDNMDRAAMARRGVWGTNCPDSFTSATADHTLCLLLAVSRKLVAADAYVRSGAWPVDTCAPGRYDGTSLEGRTLGIIGFGRIGRQVAQRAEAFGLAVSYYDEIYRDEAFMPLEQLLGWADVLTLHCPLTESTRHLINERTIALMKPGAILLNVSRGPVIEIDAVARALASGQLGGAGLDVFEFEPVVPIELFNFPNVVLTPHIGGATVESKRAAWTVCFDNVARLLRRDLPATPVTSPFAI